MTDGPYSLLLHGIDTLQCAYYLHQAQRQGFDFDGDSFLTRMHKDSQHPENGHVQTFTFGQSEGQMRMLSVETVVPKEIIPPEQPLHLSQTIRSRIRREFDPYGIFLNIPYSRRYSGLEVVIMSTVTAYGLTPRMARERTRTEIRLLKITELMLSCKFGFTDLSYVTRMNMPLELGMLLAFGKETFIASGKRYAALKTV